MEFSKHTHPSIDVFASSKEWGEVAVSSRLHSRISRISVGITGYSIYTHCQQNLCFIFFF